MWNRVQFYFITRRMRVSISRSYMLTCWQFQGIYDNVTLVSEAEEYKMTLAEKITQHVHRLPESLQAEVMDFVEYLESKAEKAEVDWSKISLASAMRGMEDEQALYSVEDIKQRFGS